MRIAIVSDIHGNRFAFDAVLADLREASPDLTLHGGDLADGGAHPAEIVDRICDLGWPGVVGNTDEMLYRPESLSEFAGQPIAPGSPFSVLEEMARATREVLGERRLSWLRGLPRIQSPSSIALTHASPSSLWRAPADSGSDTELAAIYAPLARPIVVFAHTHRPFVRNMPGLTVANCGSVGLSYDGDRRAAYLVIDDAELTIRRVEYNVDAEINALSECGLPHTAWVARSLQTATPQTPFAD